MYILIATIIFFIFLWGKIAYNRQKEYYCYIQIFSLLHNFSNFFNKGTSDSILLLRKRLKMVEILSNYKKEVFLIFPCKGENFDPETTMFKYIKIIDPKSITTTDMLSLLSTKEQKTNSIIILVIISMVK